MQPDPQPPQVQAPAPYNRVLTKHTGNNRAERRRHATLAKRGRRILAKVDAGRAISAKDAVFLETHFAHVMRHRRDALRFSAATAESATPTAEQL